MNIAICDDCKEDAIRARKIIHSIIDKYYPDTEIIWYNSAKEIENKMIKLKETLDILVLDIDMPEISGLELAEKLRENNLDLIIIFLSNHDEFVFKAIEFQPFRYIRKIKLESEMPVAIESAVKILDMKKDKQVFIETENGAVKMMMSEIMYFHMENRRLCIHLSNGQIISAYKTLSEFHNQLDEEKFIMIHKSCIVNIEYIKKFDNSSITLSNNERLPVSRLRIKQIKEHITILWSSGI